MGEIRGNIINLISGRDIPKNDHLDKPTKNSIPYITGASNLLKDRININEWIEEPKTIVEKGTILISVKGTIGKIAILTAKKAHIARQIMGIENIFLLSQNFQKYFLESYVEQLKNKSKSMIPGISREDVLLASFPLPPLEEQSRIAAKIEELFELLDTIAQAQKKYEGLQGELKEKILSLGMQGKLVDQDKNDESASILLEKINAKKAQLIKEKKIKKTKPLPEISDEEKPFDIPESWEWVRLGK
ncbi:restriction endonuclease subunit S [Lactobacillus sp. PV012]|uniref:restriction endonuclease subunit S n=1 Tax=Lactobacillus sp. PV012 TaxID=2594494 RepID=UPI00223F8F55|nr:restriction endonuclease subunit S [Lactobacillus sp. PV012]